MILGIGGDLGGAGSLSVVHFRVLIQALPRFDKGVGGREFCFFLWDA